jgi:hypothetical protein
MALIGEEKARFEIVYLDKHGRVVGRDDLNSKTDIEARHESSRKLTNRLQGRAMRSDRFIRGGYYQEKR